MTETTPRGEESDEFKVEDKRHWAVDEDGETDTAGEPAAPSTPGVLDEYRQRTETAERQLQEYIEAFKTFKDEQDDFRTRLQRDVERRVELAFAGLVEGFLESIDHLDLALRHADGVADAQPLADGVRMARKRFLATLELAGVERIEPTGTPFDPNESEALRMDAVDNAAADGSVTETLQPGYRLGDQVIRAARVAVGRHDADNRG